MLNFLWAALGVSALLVALFLAAALNRLRRALGALERSLDRADESMQELIPEVRGTLRNVNHITSGVNVGLRTAGTGAGKVGAELGERADDAGKDASAAMHGVGVGLRTLVRSLRVRGRGETFDTRETRRIGNGRA